MQSCAHQFDAVSNYSDTLHTTACFQCCSTTDCENHKCSKYCIGVYTHFSSHECNVLMMWYCDRLLSVVVDRGTSVVCQHFPFTSLKKLLDGFTLNVHKWSLGGPLSKLFKTLQLFAWVCYNVKTVCLNALINVSWLKAFRTHSCFG